MRILSFIILFLAIPGAISAQSPHGDNFDIDCSFCHESTSWKVTPASVTFDHNKTGFDLTGQHKEVNCRSCHESLIFSKAKSKQDCFSCHKDVHRGSVGYECERCHTPETWIVKDINVVHQESRFPLVGAHKLADCQQCHTDYQDLNFQVLSIDCYSCHQNDYASTNSPNHITAGFSTSCEDCHDITSMVWSATNFNHDFFALKGGHNIECSACHGEGGNFGGLSTECYSCHETDYKATTDPDHQAANFPTTCESCHTINGWSPANFDHNNTQFPLTGAHLSLDCFSCHEQDYNRAEDHLSQNYPHECQMCHNTSTWDDANFDHSTTGFQLTGAHQTVDCSSCHQNGFAGTPTACESCHLSNYNATTNPNHQAIGITTDCQTCHTTNPGWQPATFPIHNNYYELIGAHANIANDCASCHNGDYNNTPNECYGCHAEDYNNTTDPNHQAAGFGTDCVSCHSQTAWQPATFDHDPQFFPIYSGKHNGTWSACSDCHTQPNDYSIFSCITCHEHNQTDTDDQHQGVQGYIYESNACYSCHPTGEAGNAFDHNLSNFPLTGAHLTVDCVQCHINGYTEPPSTICSDCHQGAYNSTTNPDHQTLGISIDCETCHTTNPGWQPALFPQHNQYFELTGQHATVTDCNTCHNGNYNLNSSECLQCHQEDYNNALNPNHSAAGIPVTCEDCHTADGWSPSTFNHSSTGFILDGVHATVQCSECHQGIITGLNPDCVSCHQNDYNQAANPNHLAAGIPLTCQDCHNSTAWIPSTFDHSSTGFQLLGVHAQIQCSDCHQGTVTGLTPECLPCHQEDYNSAPEHVAQNYPTNCDMCHSFEGWTPSTFDHNNTNFPLTGAHLQVQCSDCHQSGFVGTPTACFACHETNYNNTTNPSHTALQLSTDCETCHTTNPGWQPALFPNHSEYFPFVGAHVAIANDCNACHNGDDNNTPNTCYGCHSDNFNATTDPPHVQLNFSHECLSCHSQSAWEPASFDHTFYTLSGVHFTMDCNQCHSEANYQPQCLSCHMDDFLQEHNIGDPTNCWDCHSTSTFGDSPIMRFKIDRD